MDTYSRALTGSRSRASGEYFEGMISAACRFYEERGISVIEKTPEPMKVLKPYDRRRGQFICCFAKQQINCPLLLSYGFKTFIGSGVFSITEIPLSS